MSNQLFLKYIFKGVLIAFLFTCVLLTIFSFLLVNTNLSEDLVQPVIITVTGISILVASCWVNRKRTKKGILNGSIIGIIYALILYIISSILNGWDFSVTLGTIIMTVVGIVSGSIGGIIGVNLPVL